MLLAVALLLVQLSNAQQLVHYWNFNNSSTLSTLLAPQL